MNSYCDAVIFTMFDSSLIYNMNSSIRFEYQITTEFKTVLPRCFKQYMNNYSTLVPVEFQNNQNLVVLLVILPRHGVLGNIIIGNENFQ